MLQLLYISTARAGIRPDEIAAILEQSRRNNAADRISGLLVHDGRRFLQALEGDAGLVERTYARIRTDGRHRAPVLLSQKAIEARQFGDWAMAWHLVENGERAATIAAVDALTAQVSDLNIREQFRSFVRIERRGA